MSKVPPEFRNPACEGRGVDRQEVSEGLIIGHSGGKGGRGGEDLVQDWRCENFRGAKI